jgi:hypothetical protein
MIDVNDLTKSQNTITNKKKKSTDSLFKRIKYYFHPSSEYNHNAKIFDIDNETNKQNGRLAPINNEINKHIGRQSLLNNEFKKYIVRQSSINNNFNRHSGRLSPINNKRQVSIDNDFNKHIERQVSINNELNRPIIRQSLIKNEFNKHIERQVSIKNEFNKHIERQASINSERQSSIKNEFNKHIERQASINNESKKYSGRQASINNESEKYSGRQASINNLNLRSHTPYESSLNSYTRLDPFFCSICYGDINICIDCSSSSKKNKHFMLPKSNISNKKKLVSKNKNIVHFDNEILKINSLQPHPLLCSICYEYIHICVSSSSTSKKVKHLILPQFNILHKEGSALNKSIVNVDN